MVVALVLAAPAQAHIRPTAGRALLGARALTHATRHHPATQPPAKTPTSCSVGIPAQTITLVDQTGQNVITSQIESALTDQSMQLRAAWGTSCVQFGSGGWDIYLRSGQQALPDGGTTYQLSGFHYGVGNPGPMFAGQPYAIVQTGGFTWMTGAARALSHELDEMLVDPTDEVRWRLGLLEVCDPVEDLTYPVDGVPVSDFVFPSYFSDGAGPWDEANELGAGAQYGR